MRRCLSQIAHHTFTNKYAPSGVPFLLAVAVNEVGDTDSIAAMAGGCCGVETSGDVVGRMGEYHQTGEPS